MAAIGSGERRARAFDRLGGWSMERHGAATRWALAGALFAVAVLARALLEDRLPAGFPFLTFFPAVVLTAFLCGTREGVAVALGCFLVAWYAFVPPKGSFALHADTAIALGLYLFVVSTEILLVHLMREAMTRLARAEARAREEATARALMFAELQHRVSNNLAVVGALLTMQRRQLDDPAAKSALEDAARRLAVVSRLSRLLHDPGAQAVDFGAFLASMVPEAVAAAAAEGRVVVSVDAAPVTVPAETAIPLGLIAAELIANALEHGIPEGRTGSLRVALAPSGDGRARLEVADDGVGLPPGTAPGGPSLGLSIARQFAKQLGGVLEVRGGAGVTSTLDFPLAGA